MNKRGQNMASDQHIRFDWAMKHLLREKSNFRILEGFLSELLRYGVHIQDILESESNKLTKQMVRSLIQKRA